MTNVLSKILACSFVVTSIGFAAPAKPPAPTFKVKDPATSVAATAEKADKKEEVKVSPILALVLNQVVSARLGFGIEFVNRTREVDGKKKSVSEIASLDLQVLIPFQDKIDYKFVKEEKADNPVKDVVPFINFNTKNLKVVVKAEIKEKGKMVVQFCHNYSVSTGECDMRPLEIVLKSKTLSEMFRVNLSSIEIDFDKNIGASKFSFKGKCNATKSGIDEGVRPVMREAICTFSGDFDAEAKTKETRFKFK